MPKPGDPCRECGIRLDLDGLCQCVDVLLGRIRELESRPRPVAEWGDDGGGWEALNLQQVTLGQVYREGDSWIARCLLRNVEEEFPDAESARAWLEERVRGMGVDIRETEGETDGE